MIVASVRLPSAVVGAEQFRREPDLRTRSVA